MRVWMIFPHQLFALDHVVAETQLLQHLQQGTRDGQFAQHASQLGLAGPAQMCDAAVMVEEFLFFKQYAFHKQKLALHRASMRAYRQKLVDLGMRVRYVEASTELCDVRALVASWMPGVVREVVVYDLVDDWLERRLQRACQGAGIRLTVLPSPMFLNTLPEIQSYFAGKSKLLMADFYQKQRRKRGILLDAQDKPVGGKWSYDEENRKKFPKKQNPPPLPNLVLSDHDQEAREYVEKYFPNNPGALDVRKFYPTTHAESWAWFEDFLAVRFRDFGPYEDAIVSTETFLHHSVLTPMLNTGLLTPQALVDRALEFAAEHQIPLNSLEGWIRQIMGWREFIRGVYVFHGRGQRTRNAWGFQAPIAESIWKRATGIEALDQTLHKVWDTGYCHHIERLMILGNWFLLRRTHPDHVYQWFMQMFIDAYDWVMVPNVYGMSQFADGGLMATKPYVSGSNYLLKMSDLRPGPWTEIWDAHFWTFLADHPQMFGNNPRMSILMSHLDKMSTERKAAMAQVVRSF
jgi:deoxyribodipyrimidine photolyase-related protein